MYVYLSRSSTAPFWKAIFFLGGDRNGRSGRLDVELADEERGKSWTDGAFAPVSIEWDVSLSAASSAICCGAGKARRRRRKYGKNDRERAPRGIPLVQLEEVRRVCLSILARRRTPILVARTTND